MKRDSKGWRTAALAVALAVPALVTASTVHAAGERTDESSASSDKPVVSKEDQAKLKEHNKLRTEIGRVKYPATKGEVVAHLRGIKPDDKKWFEATLRDRGYDSSSDVMSALGWESSSPVVSDGTTDARPRSKKTSGTDEKSEKTTK